MDMNSLLEAIQDFRSSMETRFDHLKDESIEVKNKLKEHDFKHLRHDRELRKNNIVIFGVNETPNENREELKQTILCLLKDKLKIIIEMTEINDLFRMGRKSLNKSRPILLKLVTYWKKIEIMSGRGKLKGTDIYIENDLCKEDEEKKKALIPVMLNFRSSGKHAVIKGSTLYVDGKIYENGNTTNRQKILQPQNEETENTPGKDLNKRTNSTSPSELLRDNLLGNTLNKKKRLLKHVRSSSLGQLSLSNFFTSTSQQAKDKPEDKMVTNDASEEEMETKETSEEKMDEDIAAQHTEETHVK